MRKYANVTLKRGIFHSNEKFHEWLNEKKYNEISRKIVTIALNDEKGNALIQWTLSNAYPVKIDGPTMKSDSSEVAIESIELVHEGLKVEHTKS